MNKKSVRWVVGLAALLLVLVQFVPYHRPTYDTTWDGDLGLPSALEQSIRTSCYDCHTESRSLPWYGRVAPMSWWISDENRRALAGANFSRWPDYSPRQKELIWQRSLVRLRAKMMPPPAYHLMHPSLSDQEIDALERHLQSSSDESLSHWTPDELLAWPATPWSGQTVTGVMEVPPGTTLAEPLALEGGVLLCHGDLDLTQGLTGRGALLVGGRLRVKGLHSLVGPVALLGYREVTLESSQGCRLVGYVASVGPRSDKLGGVTTDGVVIEERPNLQLQIEGVQEVQLDFCRDDAELGEYAERSMVIRYGWGQYVLWETELQEVRRASSLEQALDAAEELISGDPATSVDDWNKTFRQGWHGRLSQMSKSGEPATFRARPQRHLQVSSPPPKPRPSSKPPR